MTESLRRSWWTPEGWKRDLEPSAFSSIQVFHEKGWAEAGYNDRAIFGQEDDCWSYIVEIRGHQDGHLVVILDLPHDRWLDVFAVETEHATAFYVDKLPSMLAAAAAIDQTAEIKALRVAAESLIRHGGPARS